MEKGNFEEVILRLERKEEMEVVVRTQCHKCS